MIATRISTTFNPQDRQVDNAIRWLAAHVRVVRLRNQVRRSHIVELNFEIMNLGSRRGENASPNCKDKCRLYANVGTQVAAAGSLLWLLPVACPGIRRVAEALAHRWKVWRCRAGRPVRHAPARCPKSDKKSGREWVKTHKCSHVKDEAAAILEK